jgi:hypothetical protein
VALIGAALIVAIDFYQGRGLEDCAWRTSSTGETSGEPGSGPVERVMYILFGAWVVLFINIILDFAPGFNPACY